MKKVLNDTKDYNDKILIKFYDKKNEEHILWFHVERY